MFVPVLCERIYKQCVTNLNMQTKNIIITLITNEGCLNPSKISQEISQLPLIAIIKLR